MMENFNLKLVSLDVIGSSTIRTVWSNGAELDVDLRSILMRSGLERFLAPSEFKKVRISEWGESVEWVDSEFGIDQIYCEALRQANETSPIDVLNWCLDNTSSQVEAALRLGTTVRELKLFLSGSKPVPRRVVQNMQTSACRIEVSQPPISSVAASFVASPHIGVSN